MSLEKKAKRRIIQSVILGSALVAGVFGLTELVLNSQPKVPEISEQVADRKFKEDYNTALENYSREAYHSGQSNIPIPTFVPNSELFAFVKAYSQ